MARDWLQFTYTPSMIAEGTRIQGDLTFVSVAQVHGIIEGSVQQSSLETLQIGPAGWVHGSIEAKGPILVEGRVDGDIHSDTSIRLLPSASVSGVLKAPVVRVQPGAILQGEVQMPVSKVRVFPARKSAS